MNKRRTNPIHVIGFSHHYTKMHRQVWAENKKIAEEKVRRSFKKYGFEMKGWKMEDTVSIGKRIPEGGKGRGKA